jgi:glucose-1-phosphate thymidylyltransferase
VAVNPPVYVHPEAVIERSVIGPYVSVGKGAHVSDSVLRDTIVDAEAEVEAALLDHSIVGRWVHLTGAFRQLNVGDSSEVEL